MKKIIMVIVAVTFCLTMVGIAGAAEAVKPGTGTTTQQLPPGTPIPVPLFTCPTGWKKVPNQLICVPKKPATPLTCPQGYTYAEYLSCAPGQPGGGCQIGCYPTIY